MRLYNTCRPTGFLKTINGIIAHKKKTKTNATNPMRFFAPFFLQLYETNVAFIKPWCGFCISFFFCVTTWVWEQKREKECKKMEQKTEYSIFLVLQCFSMVILLLTCRYLFQPHLISYYKLLAQEKLSFLFSSFFLVFVFVIIICHTHLTVHFY